MYIDVVQSRYCLECIKLHVEYVNLLLNETFVMEKTSPENPSEKGACTVTGPRRNVKQQF